MTLTEKHLFKTTRLFQNQMSHIPYFENIPGSFHIETAFVSFSLYGTITIIIYVIFINITYITTLSFL